MNIMVESKNISKAAIAAKVTGIVLEGNFADGTAANIREAVGSATMVELTARNRMQLGSNAPILGTNQGVWPGISELQDNGAKKSGPTGSVWKARCTRRTST